MKTTYDYYRQLALIERRPGMYFCETLDSLHCFYLGYVTAMDEAEVSDVSKPSFDGFHEWVRERFGFREPTSGWANMLLAVTLGHKPEKVNWDNFKNSVSREDHKRSLDLFFELIKEYRER